MCVVQPHRPRGSGLQGKPVSSRRSPVPEAAPWELVLWSVPQAGSGGARGQVTPGRALAPWVLSTVGGQERLCPSERRLWALGAVGSKGPAAAGREGTTRAGPRPKGLRGGAGGLRAGSLPLLQSRPRLEPPGAVCPCAGLLSSSNTEQARPPRGALVGTGRHTAGAQETAPILTAS